MQNPSEQKIVKALGTSIPVYEVLTPKLWRDRYAHGMMLGHIERRQVLDGPPGERVKQWQKVISEIPDELIRWHLRVALSDVELKLGVSFGIRRIVSPPTDDLQPGSYDVVSSRLPFNRGMFESWGRLDLPYGPVLSVERVRAFFWDTKVFDISDDIGNGNLIRVEHPRQKSIHLAPLQLIQQYPQVRFSVAYSPLIYSYNHPIPDFWAVDYTIGAVDNFGEPGKIEAILADYIYCSAALKIFAIASQNQGKGQASSSLSFDGISKSVTLVNGGVFGLIHDEYEKTLERINWEKLAQSKKPLRVLMY